MRIDSVHYAGFARNLTGRLDLPPVGLTVITGPNGSGKSSFIEAISTAFWGKTLRGGSPWQVGSKGGSVRVVAALAEALRQTGKRDALTWNAPGRLATAWESPTIAQDQLERVVGTQAIWRRTSVFSASDADNWTTASSGERLKLLERLLGVDRIDQALKVARKRLSEKEAAHNVEAGRQLLAKRDLEAKQQRLADQRTRLAETKAGLLALEAKQAEQDQATVIADGKKLAGQLDSVKEELVEVRRQRTALGDTAAKLNAELESAESRQAQLDVDQCPVCEREIPSELVARETTKAAELRTRLERERETAARTRVQLDAQALELEEDRQKLEERRQAKVNALQNLQQVVKSNAARDAREIALKATEAAADREIAQLVKDVAALEKQIAEATTTIATAVVAVSTMRAATEVLGLKGPRLVMTARALVGLGKATNFWLHRVSRGAMAIRLEADRQAKDGSGAISEITQLLELGGDEDWREFRSFSGGERQRVNAASVMALAEIARVSHGIQEGTVFFDEVFEALDENGVGVVCEALGELAKTSSVVVITHHPALVAQLPAVQRIRLSTSVLQAAA